MAREAGSVNAGDRADMTASVRQDLAHGSIKAGHASLPLTCAFTDAAATGR